MNDSKDTTGICEKGCCGWFRIDAVYIDEVCCVFINPYDKKNYDVSIWSSGACAVCVSSFKIVIH